MRLTGSINLRICTKIRSLGFAQKIRLFRFADNSNSLFNKNAQLITVIGLLEYKLHYTLYVTVHLQTLAIKRISHRDRLSVFGVVLSMRHFQMLASIHIRIYEHVF